MEHQKFLEPNALQLDERDNVAISLRDIKAGEFLIYVSGISTSLQVAEDIPYGHKVSLTIIPKGEKVMKYGEWMGVATKEITPGHHVHVRDVRGLNEEERDNFNRIGEVNKNGNI